MANPEHVEIVKAGKDAIDQWREINPDTELDLSESDLGGIDLAYAVLTDANLIGTKLTDANLGNAVLNSVDLTYADLGGANFSRSEIYLARFVESNLNGANFLEVDLAHAVFVNIELNSILELQSVDHRFPSFIDMTSIQRLEGVISDAVAAFLRGCGLEKWEIESARLHTPGWPPEQVSEHLTTIVFPALTPGAFYLGGVFISYAHDDWDLVEKLWIALKEQDINTYLDRHDFTSGSLEKNISRAIRINDQVVVVLSEHSLSSDWVWDEIESTLEKEKEIGKDILFPIRIDDACFDHQRNKRHLTRLIKQRLILDFSDPSNFDENLNKLITGMKVNQ